MIRAPIALLSVLAIAGATAVAAQTPVDPSAAPTPATPAPPAAPTPPPAPTGDAAKIITVLDKFCVPAIGGTQPAKLASAVGLRKNRDDDYVLSLGGPKRITVTAPNTSNPTVCTLSVLYDIGGEPAIYDALNNWALAHANPYTPARVRETSQVGDETHITSTWSAVEADGAEGLVFIQQRTADGKPLTGRADEATVLFSIRPNT